MDVDVSSELALDTLLRVSANLHLQAEYSKPGALSLVSWLWKAAATYHPKGVYVCLAAASVIPYGVCTIVCTRVLSRVANGSLGHELLLQNA